MKRFVVFATLVVALGGAVILQFAGGGGSSRFEAPDFSLPDLQGQSHTLSAYRGKVVFLNLWATWCPPCREEMPSMDRLYRRFADAGLVMLAVSQDEGSRAGVESFVRGLGLSFPVLLDPEGRLPGRYGVTGYPETFLIDRNGRIVEHIVGPEDWFSEEAQKLIADLLAQPYAAPTS